MFGLTHGILESMGGGSKGVWNDIISDGSISYSGDIIIYSFTSDGSFYFSFPASIEVSIFVIAGGGGGGYAEEATAGESRAGGGGGAGGVSITNLTLTANTPYYAFVGAASGACTQGNDSIFRDASTELVKAFGGGRGGCGYVTLPDIFATSGGSGGGGGALRLPNPLPADCNVPGDTSAGTATHYGNGGGRGQNTSSANTAKGGSGGGAMSAGSTSVGSGAGILLTLTDASTYYAYGGRTWASGYDGLNITRGSGGNGALRDAFGAADVDAGGGQPGIIAIKFKYK